MKTKNEELIKRLDVAAGSAAKRRLARFLARPIKLAYPKLLSIAHLTVEKQATTFWGDLMSVQLPELISIKIWRYGYFDEDVCRYLLHVLQPGMTFVDVGAHFGFFTLLAASLVGDAGRVLSFEPTPYTFSQLEKNTTGRRNIELVNCAAFDSETQLALRDFGIEFSAYNSAFGMRQDAEHRRPVSREFQVSARRADDVVNERHFDAVHLIKIDAESSELKVLQGLTETLQRHRPKVILETGDFELEGVPKTEQIIGWLRELGYWPHEVGRDGLLQPAESASFNYVGRNFLFIPQTC
jgi:FkbM family methyltransferase